MAAIMRLVDNVFVRMALKQLDPARAEANMAYHSMYFRETFNLAPATADPTTEMAQWTRPAYFRFPEVGSMSGQEQMFDFLRLVARELNMMAHEDEVVLSICLTVRILGERGHMSDKFFHAVLAQGSPAACRTLITTKIGSLNLDMMTSNLISNCLISYVWWPEN